MVTQKMSLENYLADEAQKMADKPFTIVGDGNQTRDFTFVTDVVEAIIAAAESNVSDEIINIG